jgi:polar amino acid transport system substrate-binding protein
MFIKNYKLFSQSIWLLWVFVPNLLLASDLSRVSNKVINIALGEYPPYYSQKLPGYGEIPRLVSSAFMAEGYEVKYTWLPWARAYTKLAEGEFDGSFTGAKTPEREEKFYFSEPLRNNKIVFFHRKDYPFNWNTVEDLKKYTIAVTTGYAYSTEFTQAMKEKIIIVQRTPDDLLGFKKLLGKRVQLFPISLDVGLFKLKENFAQEEIDHLTYHAKALDENFVHLILTRHNSENEKLLKRFNHGIKQMEKKVKNY